MEGVGVKKVQVTLKIARIIDATQK